MPASVTNASPATVFPAALYSAFQRSTEWKVDENEYADGSSQRRELTSTSRKRWRLAARLTATQMTALRTFVEARRGGLEPFYFYDPSETNPKWTSDPTGAATDGRYTVVITTPTWDQQMAIPRGDVSLELAEVT